jgi:hypothetical protein
LILFSDKKDEQFFSIVHSKLETSPNPFLESLIICRSCEDFGIPGRITLAHDCNKNIL